MIDIQKLYTFNVQTYLRGIVGLVLDRCKKASIAVKQVVIFLPVESIAFNL